MEQTKLFKNKDSKMYREEDSDQLRLLAQEIESLIEKAIALTQEKAALAEKLQMHEKILANLSKEIRNHARARDKAKQGIASLIMKIDKVIGKKGKDDY